METTTAMPSLEPAGSGGAAGGGRRYRHWAMNPLGRGNLETLALCVVSVGVMIAAVVPAAIGPRAEAAAKP